MVSASTVLLLAGCGLVRDGENLGSTSEAALAQNTSCQIGTTCSLSALYPSGVPSGRMAVVASEGAMIGGQAELRGTSGDLGVLASSTGLVTVQAQAKTGGVWTRGTAFIGSQATATKILTGTPPQIQQGAIYSEVGTASGEPAKATFNVTFPSGAMPNVTLQNSQQQTLSPGRYGTLHVFNGSTVNLQTGVYYFEEVKLEPGALAVVNTTAGTAIVWVRGELMSRGRWTSSGSPSDILVGSFYQGSIDLGQEFDATLIAPGAHVILGSANNPARAHNGLYFGRTVEVQSGARVTAVNVSKQGDPYGGLDGDWDPADGVTPPDLPSPDGLTYDEYRDQLRDYLTNLIESGYTGPPIEVPAHPAASTVDDLSGFKVPVGENNPGGGMITLDDAPPVPPRPQVPLGKPVPTSTVPIQAGTSDGRTLPSDSYIDSPHLAAAFDELEGEVDAAVQQTTSELPFTDLSVPETGKGVGPAPTFPKTCQLANVTIPSNATVGDVTSQFPVPFHRGIDYGKPPAWINLDAFPDDPDRVIDSAVPDFDAYWFLQGYLESGFAADRGLYGEIEGQLSAGGAVLGFPIRIADVKIYGEANMQDERNGRGGDPYLSTQLVAYAAGTTWYKFGRAIDTDLEQPLFKQNLLSGKFKLIPGDGIEFWVGPFNIEVNAGVEINAPLALNIDVTGPEATFAPMVRAFISVFGGIDFGLKVGLEGEADLLRVDAPFSAKLKWHNRLNPQECAMAADFKATLRMDFTTLNGTLYVVAGISDSLIPGAMYREELFSWEGITLFSEEINLLDLPFPDVLKYPDFLCQFGAQTCATQADPNLVLSDFETTHSGFELVQATDYGSSDCPGQYVVEIPVTNYNEDGVWVQAKWRSSDVTPATCNDSYLRLDSWKLVNGAWVQIPAVNISGSLNASGTCVQTASGAILPPGESQLFNNPWHFIAKEPGMTKVRLAVTTEVSCETKRIEINANDERF